MNVLLEKKIRTMPWSTTKSSDGYLDGRSITRKAETHVASETRVTLRLLGRKSRSLFFYHH